MIVKNGIRTNVTGTNVSARLQTQKMIPRIKGETEVFFISTFSSTSDISAIIAKFQRGKSAQNKAKNWCSK
jgi:hypothetical protein